MKILVIGGTGHIGTYLVPWLVEAGHQVVNISRGASKPYLPHPAWQRVEQVIIDREQAEKEGTFGAQAAALKPDVVIDMVSFTVASTRGMVEALQGKIRHFLHCGTIWVKGYVVEAPTREETYAPPFGEYGINKLAIEEYLLDLARRGDFPASMVNPGHIVGPGHPPVNPMGNHNPAVFSRLAKGQPFYLPHFGMELVHHVHGVDVAQVFFKAMENWSVSIGEQFNAVSAAALTLRGFASAAAGWFNRTADLRFVPWEEWKQVCDLLPEDIEDTFAHIERGQCCSIAKAQRLLGYQPRYSSLEAVKEAVDWYVERKLIEI